MNQLCKGLIVRLEYLASILLKPKMTKTVEYGKRGIGAGSLHWLVVLKLNVFEFTVQYGLKLV